MVHAEGQAPAREATWLAHTPCCLAMTLPSSSGRGSWGGLVFHTPPPAAASPQAPSDASSLDGQLGAGRDPAWGSCLGVGVGGSGRCTRGGGCPGMVTSLGPRVTSVLVPCCSHRPRPSTAHPPTFPGGAGGQHAWVSLLLITLAPPPRPGLDSATEFGTHMGLRAGSNRSASAFSLGRTRRA